MGCSATNLASALNSSLANCLRWSAPLFLCFYAAGVVPNSPHGIFLHLLRDITPILISSQHWFITARPNFNDWNGHNIWRSFGSFFHQHWCHNCVYKFNHFCYYWNGPFYCNIKQIFFKFFMEGLFKAIDFIKKSN